MDWKELKELEINEQIDKFNELIKEHGSITKAAKELGISDSTTRKYFKPLGYSFNGSEYVKNINTQLEGRTSLIEPINENKGILNINELSEKNKSKTDITDLEQLINKLIDQRLSELQKVEKTDIELDSKCEGNTAYRTYGVFQTVSDEFGKYAKKHSRYSKVELMSQALIEFMERHK